VYDSLNDRMMDVSLFYNKVALNSIIEYAKEIVGETTAIGQAEETFGQFDREQDLAKKYVYAQDIINICNREILAEKEGYNADEIKIIYLWDFDKVSKEENFFDELKNIKTISIYNITNADADRYTCEGCAGEFPLEKFSEAIVVNKTLIKAPVCSFDNLRIIDEKDEIYADPRIYGGSEFTCDEIATMLWSISLRGGQTLEIWRENDVTIVKGVMEQPQSETMKKYSDLLK